MTESWAKNGPVAHASVRARSPRKMDVLTLPQPLLCRLRSAVLCVARDGADAEADVVLKTPAHPAT